MYKHKLLAIFIAFSVATVALSSLYSGDSKVVKLTTDNFKKNVLNSNEMWLVEFYGNLYHLCHPNQININHSPMVWSLSEISS